MCYNLNFCFVGSCVIAWLGFLVCFAGETSGVEYAPVLELHQLGPPLHPLGRIFFFAVFSFRFGICIFVSDFTKFV